MSIKFALLGLLAHTSRHGYDLKRDFEATFSQMRSVNAGQIYTNLAVLSKEGLVSSQTIEQPNSPAKKVYAITPDGRQKLLEWLAQPVEDSFEQVRSEFFVKLMVQALLIGHQTDDAAGQAMIEQQRQRLRDDINELKHQRLQATLFIAPGATDPRTPVEQELSEIRLLLLEGALLHLEADLQWLGLIEARLHRLLAQRQVPLTPSQA